MAQLLYTESIMDLSTAQQVIAVILAAALAIFIILGIVAAIMVIRLLKMLNMIARKAEKVVESAETAATIFKNAAGPASIFSFVKGVVHTVKNHDKKEE